MANNNVIITSLSGHARMIQDTANEIRLLVLASQQAITQDVDLCKQLMSQMYSKVNILVSASEKNFTKARQLETDHNRQRKLVQAKSQTIDCLRRQLSQVSSSGSLPSSFSPSPSVQGSSSSSSCGRGSVSSMSPLGSSPVSATRRYSRPVLALGPQPPTIVTGSKLAAQSSSLSRASPAPVNVVLQAKRKLEFQAEEGKKKLSPADLSNESPEELMLSQEELLAIVDGENFEEEVPLACQLLTPGDSSRPSQAIGIDVTTEESGTGFSGQTPATHVPQDFLSDNDKIIFAESVPMESSP